MYSSTKSSLVLGGIASTRLMTIIDEIGRINRLIELSEERVDELIRKHSDKYIFYTLRFDCSFAAANTIKPQLL